MGQLSHEKDSTSCNIVMSLECSPGCGAFYNITACPAKKEIQPLICLMSAVSHKNYLLGSYRPSHAVSGRLRSLSIGFSMPSQNYIHRCS